MTALIIAVLFLGASIGLALLVGTFAAIGSGTHPKSPLPTRPGIDLRA